MNRSDLPSEAHVMFRYSLFSLALLPVVVIASKVTIHGLKGKFEIINGNRACPLDIEHATVTRKNGAYQLSNSDVTHNDVACEGENVLEVRKTEPGKNPDSLAMDKQLAAELRAPYYHGVLDSARVCGISKVANGTHFFFVNTESPVAVPKSSVTLEADTKYMVFIEPNGNTCVYQKEGTEEDGLVPSAEPSDGRACFPAEATVKLMNGREKEMHQLKVGDMVQVGPATYSQVYGFTHADEDALTFFVELKTEAREEVVLSPGHYVYANEKLVPASDVEVGDTLQLANGRRSRVVSVGSSLNDGLYNPQTVHGDIVVNNVVVSTYTTAVKPSIAHCMLLPFRAMFRSLGMAVFLTSEERLPSIKLVL